MEKTYKKYKLILIALCILVFILVLGVGIYQAFKKDKEESKYSEELTKLINTKMELKDLREISYSCSGDMLGNLYDISLNLKTKVVTLRNSNEHSDPIDVYEYSVTDDDIKGLTSKVKEYNLAAWSKQPYDDSYFVYDACSPNIQLTYFDEKEDSYDDTYNISFYFKLPDDARTILEEIRTDIQNLANDGNLIVNYQEGRE